MRALKKSLLTGRVAAKAAPKSADLSERVRDETLEALLKAKIIGAEERVGFQRYLISKSVSSGDILPVMAYLRGISEDEQTGSIKQWARSITPIVKKRYSLVPFASKLLGQSPIFEKYEEVRKAAGKLKCPLIFSEDSDVIGFGTLNPVAGACLAEHVADHLEKETSLKPYISTFLLDYPTWVTICERQFGK